MTGIESAVSQRDDSRTSFVAADNLPILFSFLDHFLCKALMGICCRHRYDIVFGNTSYATLGNPPRAMTAGFEARKSGSQLIQVDDEHVALEHASGKQEPAD